MPNYRNVNFWAINRHMLALQGLQYQGSSLLLAMFWYLALGIPAHFWRIQRLQTYIKRLTPLTILTILCMPVTVNTGRCRHCKIGKKKFVFPFSYFKKSFGLSLVHLWCKEFSHLGQTGLSFAVLTNFIHFVQLYVFTFWSNFSHFLLSCIFRHF